MDPLQLQSRGMLVVCRETPLLRGQERGQRPGEGRAISEQKRKWLLVFGLWMWLTPVRVQAHHSPGVAAASKHHREVHRDHGSVRVHAVSQTRGIESQVQCDRAKLPGLTVGHIEGERGAI